MNNERDKIEEEIIGMVDSMLRRFTMMVEDKDDDILESIEKYEPVILQLRNVTETEKVLKKCDEAYHYINYIKAKI